MKIRVLIVDDHSVMREGLKKMLETQNDIEAVGSASNGEEAVKSAIMLHPDVILMDISMAHTNGIEATESITKQLPTTKVIMLSMHNSCEYIHRSLQAGAKGYLLKEFAADEITEAIRTVMRGRMFFGAGVDLSLENTVIKYKRAIKSPIESLSHREREVLQLVVEGIASMKIAEFLKLSPKSVDTYRRRIMLKLGVTNIPALVKFAIQHGITSL